MSDPTDKRLTYLLEKANQYRLYVQLSEQKAAFLFAGLGVLANVNSAAVVPGASHVFVVFRALGFLASIFGAYITAAIAFELPLLWRPRKEVTVHDKLRYGPLRHADFFARRLQPADLGTAESIASEILDELQQLAILHEQRRNALRVASRAGFAALTLTLAGSIPQPATVVQPILK